MQGETPAPYNTENFKKMKKIYFSPETEVIDIKLEAPILMESGGGINDDGSASTSEGGSDNPSEDYGW